MQFAPTDFDNLTRCPWCDETHSSPWGQQVRGFDAVKCNSCAVIYVQNRLNGLGLKKFYSNYFSERHTKDENLANQRLQMYQIEFEFVQPHIRGRRVLDVGCGGGFFLDLFAKNGYESEGVEYGSEAYELARQRHKVSLGTFPEVEIEGSFDLIVFRGVLEHIPFPKPYLDKALSLLAENGLIYVTSTPNSESIACSVFEEKWNQFEPEEHIVLFGKRHLDEYFAKAGLWCRASAYFYEETPYASPKTDILKMAEAIQLRQANRQVPFRSPSFPGTMLTAIYGG